LEGRDDFHRTVAVVGNSPDIDSILILSRLDWGLVHAQSVDDLVRGMVQQLKDAAEQSPVPVAVAMRAPENAEVMGAMEKFYEVSAEAALPVYPDYRRALTAIAKYVAWNEARV
jgi:hypothetical protein